MLNAILSIAGSSHQGHGRFSEISRGSQCCLMSFSALLRAQSFPVQHWDTVTVDQILLEGDRMYLNAFESQRFLYCYSCVLKMSLFMKVKDFYIVTVLF